MDLAELFDYSWNCNRAMHRTLLEHPTAFSEPFETLSAFKTIRDLLAHCVGAEQRWLEVRILGGHVDPYESRAADSIDGLFADMTTVRATTRAYFDGLTPRERARLIEFTLGQWEHTGRLSVEQMLFHILNHESFHRGQISMALQRFGVDPPNFDFPFMHG